MAAVAYVPPSTSIGFHQPTGAELLEWQSRLADDSRAERNGIFLCVLIGFILNLVAIVAAAIAIDLLIHLRVSASIENVPPQLLLASGAFITSLSFLLAIFTKPDGRAERAREMLEGRNHTGGVNRPESLAITLIMIVALYGSYCLVEAARRAHMRWRLRHIDPSELSRLIACIIAAPAGIPIAHLRKQGQTLQSLRAPLATLLLYNWIILLDENTVSQQTPAMRICLRRHPLADALQPSV